MISMIAAMDKSRAIGKDNDLPWRIPSDLKNFKKITSGHAVIMGRKTYESIGRPLPNRRNIVLTRGEWDATEKASSVEEALEMVDNAFVIGGGEVYSQFLPFADMMYLSLVDTDCDGDTFFPEFSDDDWDVVSSDVIDLERDEYSYTYAILKAKNK